MRTVLYANRELSEFLRENFVLAWTSERPVPRVTVDFGDGRKLESTVTGNAAHYVLDSAGRPLDVLPGLYEPRTFRRALRDVIDLHRRIANEPEDKRAQLLHDYHRLTGHAIRATGSRQRTNSRQMQIPQFAAQLQTMQSEGDSDAEWRIRAAGYPDMVRLDRRSVVLMARDLPEAERRALTPALITEIAEETRAFPSAARATMRSMSKASFERPVVEQIVQSNEGLQGMLARFMETLAADTLRAEMEFRPRIREWYVAGEVKDFASLNERVYREIFLTPSDDPWLGLRPEGTYSALHQLDSQS
jgi:hypothetical protein